MRPFLGALCAVVALLIADDCAAATDSALPLVRLTNAATPAPAPFCLGGVLSERPTGDYLTVSDYPAFAALVADIRRAFICGDSIPPFLPTSERAGFTSRHR